jgi:hypothetical protein
LTEWHFRILEKLGHQDLPNSYIKYLADRLTGMDLSAVVVNNLTLYAFLGPLLISIILNLRDIRSKR